MGLKGIFFTGDALIAAFILIAVLLAASTFYVHEQDMQDISFFSQDVVNVLSNLRVSEISNPYVLGLIENGSITDVNNTVLEQIAAFYAEEKESLAGDLFENIIGSVMPGAISVGVWVDGSSVYMRNITGAGFVSSFSKFVSGIERYRPIDGYSAKIYLKGFDFRRTTAFAYFGGFVGQGNVSQKVFLEGNITGIDDVLLELDAGGNFSLYINSNYAGRFIKGSAGGGYMRPDSWYLDSSSHAFFVPGDNTVHLKFDRLGYVAGGFLSVTYNTKTRHDTLVRYSNTTASSRYWFPGITGVINLYDSFNVPGTLNSMRLHLNFKSAFPTYLTIGSASVLLSNGSAANITLDLSNLSNYPYSLNFAALSNSTVPIRMASYNITTRNITGSNADVVLITDMSGSMRWKIGSWDEQNGVIRTCNDPLIYAASNTRRVSVAKCLDINFTDMIMASIGNREWLVDFEESAHYFSSDLSDLTKPDLTSHILSYSNLPSGGTCLCCSINLAYNILSSFTSPERKKYVIVMTDGIPTYCCGSAGVWWNRRCANGTATSTQYQPSACTGGQEDCNNNDCDSPRNNAIWSAARIERDFNARVYTIGMGPIAGCRAANLTLHRIAQVGNGTYNASQDGSKLRDVFRSIAQSIQAEVDQVNQEIIIKGNLTRSVLYPESYIEINYTPVARPPGYADIQVSGQSARFGNNASSRVFFIPSSALLLSLSATSYSADQWTDNVSLQNSNWHQVFSLSDSFVDYSRLGDPFVVMVRPDLFSYGINNTIAVRTGVSPLNSSGGSTHNRLVYSVLVKNSVGYSDVYPLADGCNWTLSFDDGSNVNVLIPSGYNGTKRCSHANFSAADAIDQSSNLLFSNLDFDSDGSLAVKIGEDDLVLDSLAISEVPSMWGPSIVSVRVWK